MFRDLFLGFVKLHILYHASKAPVFGLDLIRELARHGYTLSPGTIYPILHGLEKEGFLEAQKEVVRGKVRKYYSATQGGRDALAQATIKAEELTKELQEG
jgi:PadR family transcriptional regulator, regulatory protein PadR